MTRCSVSGSDNNISSGVENRLSDALETGEEKVTNCEPRLFSGVKYEVDVIFQFFVAVIDDVMCHSGHDAIGRLEWMVVNFSRSQ